MKASSVTSWAKWGILSAIFIWMSALVLLSNGVFRQEFGDGSRRAKEDEILDQLGQALSELRALRDQNEQLRKLADLGKKHLGKELERREPDAILHNPQRSVERVPGVRLDSLQAVELRPRKDRDPLSMLTSGANALYSKEHEVARRSLDNSVRELYFYLYSQLGKQKKGEADASFADRAINQTLSLLAESTNFGAKIDNASEWHSRILHNLTLAIQTRIERLQNPKDCKKARVLICDLNKGCGFGCQLHHLAYCLVVAAATNRTMVMENDGAKWQYSSKGWTAVFHPVTRCTFSTVTSTGESTEPWAGVQQTARIVRLPIVDGLAHRPPHLPLAFPVQLSDLLLTHHSNPPVYFVSQFIWYLMRSNEHMSEVVAEAEAKIPFSKGPVVGLQIRRTDKVGTEAAYHSVDEYMKWTEHWFRIQEYREKKSIARRVYIATDDPAAVTEARDKYKNYEVFADVGIAKSAQLASRYTDSSLYGVVTDIQILSKCDYLVCTFSSQVCRMGYELMQVLQGDAADKFHSLDDIYYYGGQQAHEEVVVEAHQPADAKEIALEIGDVVGIAGNHWDGFSKGTNRRTGQTGLYPSYKTREKWIVVDFPIFNDTLFG